MKTGNLLPPRRQERQVRKFNFFAAFAPLREIFRFLVAASPRWASVVKISSHETRKNQKNKKDSVQIILKKMRMNADQAKYAERTYDQYANIYFERIPYPSATGIKTVLESLVKKTPKPKARIQAPLWTRAFSSS